MFVNFTEIGMDTSSLKEKYSWGSGLELDFWKKSSKMWCLEIFCQNLHLTICSEKALLFWRIRFSHRSRALSGDVWIVWKYRYSHREQIVTHLIVSRILTSPGKSCIYHCGTDHLRSVLSVKERDVNFRWNDPNSTGWYMAAHKPWCRLLCHTFHWQKCNVWFDFKNRFLILPDEIDCRGPSHGGGTTRAPDPDPQDGQPHRTSERTICWYFIFETILRHYLDWISRDGGLMTILERYSRQGSFSEPCQPSQVFFCVCIANSVFFRHSLTIFCLLGIQFCLRQFMKSLPMRVESEIHSGGLGCECECGPSPWRLVGAQSLQFGTIFSEICWFVRLLDTTKAAPCGKQLAGCCRRDFKVAGFWNCRFRSIKFFSGVFFHELHPAGPD